MKIFASTKLTAIFLGLGFVLSITSCAQNNGGEQIFQAINKTDTAVLHLTKMGKHFYGKYQIFHSSYEKDSGTVSGLISGDTLKGTFLYVPYYNSEELKRKPVAFLEQDGKLILGTGSVSVYLGIPFFSPDIPIKYNSPDFIFKKLRVGQDVK